MPFILPNHFNLILSLMLQMVFVHLISRFFICSAWKRTSIEKNQLNFRSFIFMKTNWHASIISWLLHFKSLYRNEWVRQISKFSISNINLFLLLMFNWVPIQLDRLTRNRIEWHETKASSNLLFCASRVNKNRFVLDFFFSLRFVFYRTQNYVNGSVYLSSLEILLRPKEE